MDKKPEEKKRKITIIPTKKPYRFQEEPFVSRGLPPEPDRLASKKIGIYCRVSTNGMSQLRSLASQASFLVRKCASRYPQWEIADIFLDIASSKQGSHRPEFVRMIEACREKKINIIVTKAIDRFGRDTVEVLQTIRELRAAGVEVVFDDAGLDTKSAKTELEITLRAALSEADNFDRSTNIKWGIEAGIKNNTSGLYKRKCYGYRQNSKGELVIDKSEANVVKKIFSWYAEGLSVIRIIKKLEELGIQSPKGNTSWSKRSIELMLRNEKYIGNVILHYTDMSGTRRYKGMYKKHQAIITDELFEAVQAARKERAKRQGEI